MLSKVTEHHFVGKNLVLLVHTILLVQGIAYILCSPKSLNIIIVEKNLVLLVHTILLVQGIEYILRYPNSLNIIIVSKNLVLLDILLTVQLVHQG